MAAKKTTKEKTTATVTKLKDRARTGDTDALETVEEIVKNFNAWQEAEARKKEVSKECKQREDQEFASLKHAVEDTIPAPCGPQQVEDKLKTVESCWQEWQDVKLQSAEEKRETTDAAKAAREKLERAVKDSAQLVLKLESGERVG